MDRLSDSYRLIYYDQRGRGKSVGDIQPADVSIKTEIEDLLVLTLLVVTQIVMCPFSFIVMFYLEEAVRGLHIYEGENEHFHQIR